MRQCQERRASLCFGLKRNHLAETRRGFLGPLQAVEQDAEIRVRVDVLRIEPDRRAIRASASAGFPVALNSTPRLLWAFA